MSSCSGRVQSLSISVSLLLLTPLALLPLAALAQDAAAASLQVGATARGEITSSNRLNYSDGSRSAVYDIDLQRDQAVRFEGSGPLCSQLLVLRDGQRVAGPGKSDCDDSGGHSALTFVADEGGRYQVAVSGQGAHAFGPFALRVKALEVFRGGVLRAGVDITDTLDSGTKSYPLSVQRAGLYVIDMRSDDFDAKLKLSGNGIDIENDDGGDGTNARLSAILQPGEYRLTANALDDDGAGVFQLGVQQQPIPANAVTASGSALPQDGRTVTAMLNGDELGFRLSLRQRRLVTLAMHSSDFDAKLALQGNGISLEDDDGGNGTDARIASVLDPGDYSVTATSANDSSGMFTITTTAANVPANAGGGELRLGSPRDAVLIDTNAKDRYRLAVSAAGRYVIRMSSDDFDTYVALSRGDEEIDHDDDGGGGTNSVLHSELRAGTYEITAAAADNRAGRYRIVVSRDDGTVSGTDDEDVSDTAGEQDVDDATSSSDSSEVVAEPVQIESPGEADHPVPTAVQPDVGSH